MIHHYIGCTFIIGDYSYILDGEEFDRWNTRCKLILRPLLSMTPEEAVELCQIACPIIFGDYRFSKWQATIDPTSHGEETWYDVVNLNANEDFCIYLKNGEISVYDEDGDPMPYHLNPCYQQWYFHKGFAVPMYPSGKTLIELGMAIDSTKI